MKADFIRVTGWKINIQERVAFLYSNDEITEREIKKQMSFTLATKIKHLEINSTKEMKNLYREYYKTLQKENHQTSQNIESYYLLMY